MANNPSGPLPSRLVFLSDLPCLTVGDKVRFLGCVEKYDIKSATLILKHEYPADAMPYTAAYVNIEHLLENMKKENMEKGAWINVIGYVVPQSIEEMRPKIMISDHCSAFVQAIAMWSAGTIEQKSYERSLAQRMMTGK